MFQKDLFKICVCLEFYCIFYTLSLQFHKKKNVQCNKGRVCNFGQCECSYCNNAQQNETRENKIDTTKKIK